MAEADGASIDVVCDDVRFSYGGSREFAFNCTFAAGRITALMGASGSGKSTLLNLIAGFEVPTAGRVLMGGVDVTAKGPASRPVSMVFQDNNLFSHLDVAANVGLGISSSLKLDEDACRRVETALAEVGLAGRESAKPGELSGGERQRVALARVLVRSRPVLLLDEAFGSLGPGLRDDMLDLVAAMARAHAMNVIMITHDPDDARRIADDVVFLAEGAVSTMGRTAIVLDPDMADPAVKSYLGR